MHFFTEKKQEVNVFRLRIERVIARRERPQESFKKEITSIAQEVLDFSENRKSVCELNGSIFPMVIQLANRNNELMKKIVSKHELMFEELEQLVSLLK